MKQAKFPAGWDEERVKRLLATYENQSEAQAVAEDEAGVDPNKGTVMEVPVDLVSKVRELIARQNSKTDGT